MSVRQIVLGLVALLVVAGLASALTYAQVRKAEPRVLSGSDIGFRLDGTDASGQPTGTLVVQMNGKWVEARFTAGTVRVPAR